MKYIPTALFAVLAAVIFVFGSGQTHASSSSNSSSEKWTPSRSASEQQVKLNAKQVQLVQYTLRDLGYGPGEYNGKWSAKTTRAIQAYQRSIGKTATGYLTQSSACKLLKRGVSKYGSSSRLPGWCNS